jgi:hypothetical protein
LFNCLQIGFLWSTHEPTDCIDYINYAWFKVS